jgi:hypothetical protein
MRLVSKDLKSLDTKWIWFMVELNGGERSILTSLGFMAVTVVVGLHSTHWWLKLELNKIQKNKVDMAKK